MTQRRTLLKLAAGMPVMLPVYGIASGSVNSGTLAYTLVNRQMPASSLRVGDLVLADTAVDRYIGGGLYLYPDWGAPQVYRVRQDATGALAFSYPGAKAPLWYSTLPDTRFAGRLKGLVEREQVDKLVGLTDSLPLLQVPVLPVGKSMT